MLNGHKSDHLFQIQRRRIDNYIRHEFHSVRKLLIHFSISLIQLISVLGILGLQILIILTQTCVYYIGVGFWSIPFLLIAPVSIWYIIWRRTFIACSIAIIIHLIANLFATSIIIISFLALINQIECRQSSLNMYYISINSSFIGIAGLFKIFNYCEIILLYRLKRKIEQIPIIINKDSHNKDSILQLNSTYTTTTTTTTTWDSWSTINSEISNDFDHFYL